MKQNVRTQPHHTTTFSLTMYFLYIKISVIRGSESIALFFVSLEMELTVIIFVAMCFVTPTISAPTLPRNSSSSRTLISDAEILISLLIVPRVKNATDQVCTKSMAVSKNNDQLPFLLMTKIISS